MQEGLTSLTLLERVRNHDQEAWQRLLYLYAPLVRYWCHSWGVQPADADDIQQNVFLAVSQTLESFRRERPGDTFRGWLRVIAHRKFVDLCRARKQQPSSQVNADAFAAPGATVEETEDSPGELRRLYHRALELVRCEFEERTWSAFWQCAVVGRLPANVALDMGMTPVAVRKAKSRVLRRLREELGDVITGFRADIHPLP